VGNRIDLLHPRRLMLFDVFNTFDCVEKAKWHNVQKGVTPPIRTERAFKCIARGLTSPMLRNLVMILDIKRLMLNSITPYEIRK
jgi:hypothetical protein